MKKAPGAYYKEEEGCTFNVWAPFAESVSVEIISPTSKNYPLDKGDNGYWTGTFSGIKPGSRYFYVLNNELRRPDPASFSQPEGVHGASELIDHNKFKWTDMQWRGIPPENMIIYELHTGTFSEDGTFAGVANKLDYLIDLGVNAIELMPVAQFPGTRNWGYDGTYPFAVQDSYGGVEGLKSLIDFCHNKGIAVILDVVYNHMGPEGCYLRDFGPYFTEKYNTPWGAAINFDDAYCDEVRHYFIENAKMWFHDFHFDALRLDAVHAIKDTGAKHFLQELSENITELSGSDDRDYYLIAESDLNDSRIVRSPESGGYGIYAQWSDDFHHALHTLATGERSGYYRDFGEAEDLAKAYRDTFVYDWRYSPSRQKTFGSSVADISPGRFVVCIQNHDQVGNRMMGDRLSSIVSFEMYKLVAGAILISPYVPLLFMGEEYGETNPFQYFISHTDTDLVEAVRKGRKREFASFGWKGSVPDPQSQETFKQCKLQWNYDQGKHETLFRYYQKLISFRKEYPVLGTGKSRLSLEVNVQPKTKIFTIKRHAGDNEVFCILNFEKKRHRLYLPDLIEGWTLLLDSAEKEWQGPGKAPDPGGSGGYITINPESIQIYISTTSFV